MDFTEPHPDLISFEDLQAWLSSISPGQSEARRQHFPVALVVGARLAIPETRLVEFRAEIVQERSQGMIRVSVPAARVVCLRYQDRLLLGPDEISPHEADLHARLESHREPIVHAALKYFPTLRNSPVDIEVGTFTLGKCIETEDPRDRLFDPGDFAREIAIELSRIRMSHLQARAMEQATPQPQSGHLAKPRF